MEVLKDLHAKMKLVEELKVKADAGSHGKNSGQGELHPLMVHCQLNFV